MGKEADEWIEFIKSTISQLSLETGIPMILKINGKRVDRRWYQMAWWEWGLTIMFAPIIAPFAFLYLIWGFVTMIPAVVYWGCSSFWNLHLGGKG